MADRQAVVLYDAIRYKDADGNVQEALKGDEVTLTAEEFERLSSFKGRDGNPDPAVSTPTSVDKSAGDVVKSVQDTTTVAQLDAIEQAELDGKNRSSVLTAINERRAELAAEPTP